MKGEEWSIPLQLRLTLVELGYFDERESCLQRVKLIKALNKGIYACKMSKLWNGTRL